MGKTKIGRILVSGYPFLLIILPVLIYWRAVFSFLPNLPALLREAHIADQYRAFVQDGLSLIPELYSLSTPAKVFDGPLISWLVATLTPLLSGPWADPLPTDFPERAVGIGRMVTMVCTLLAGWLVGHTSSWLGRNRWFSVGLFLYSPLTLLYGRSLLPDMAALVCGLTVFLTAPMPRARLSWTFLVFLVAGAAGFFIKVPVPLPFFGGWLFYYSWHYLRPIHWRGLTLPALVSLWFLFWAILPRLFGGEPLDKLKYSNQWQWYFGQLGDRFSLDNWTDIIQIILTQALPWPVWVVFLLVSWSGFRRRKPDQNSPATARLKWLIAGLGFTMVVFWPLYRVHNYYHLPVVVVAALALAGQKRQLFGPGPNRFWRLGKGFSLPRLSKFSGLTALSLGILLAGWTLGELRMDPQEPSQLIEQGRFIQKHVPSNTLVIYASVDSWHPAYLYFAKRYGVNISVRSVNLARLRTVYSALKPRNQPVYFFLPGHLAGMGVVQKYLAKCPKRETLVHFLFEITPNCLD